MSSLHRSTTGTSKHYVLKSIPFENEYPMSRFENVCWCSWRIWTGKITPLTTKEHTSTFSNSIFSSDVYFCTYSYFYSTLRLLFCIPYFPHHRMPFPEKYPQVSSIYIHPHIERVSKTTKYLCLVEIRLHHCNIRYNTQVHSSFRTDYERQAE